MLVLILDISKSWPKNLQLLLAIFYDKCIWWSIITMYAKLFYTRKLFSILFQIYWNQLAMFGWKLVFKFSIFFTCIFWLAKCCFSVFDFWIYLFKSLYSDKIIGELLYLLFFLFSFFHIISFSAYYS